MAKPIRFTHIMVLCGLLLLVWQCGRCVFAVGPFAPSKGQPCPLYGVSGPHVKNFGYYPTQWRRWPGEEKSASSTPREIMQTPTGQPPRPLGEEDVAPPAGGRPAPGAPGLLPPIPPGGGFSPGILPPGGGILGPGTDPLGPPSLGPGGLPGTSLPGISLPGTSLPGTSLPGMPPLEEGPVEGPLVPPLPGTPPGIPEPPLGALPDLLPPGLAPLEPIEKPPGTTAPELPAPGSLVADDPNPTPSPVDPATPSQPSGPVDPASFPVNLLDPEDLLAQQPLPAALPVLPATSPPKPIEPTAVTEPAETAPSTEPNEPAGPAEPKTFPAGPPALPLAQPQAIAPSPEPSAPVATEPAPTAIAPSRPEPQALQANWTAALHPDFQADAARNLAVYPSTASAQPVTHHTSFDPVPTTPRMRVSVEDATADRPLRQVNPTPQREILPLALDGFCPVELVSNERWTAGNPRWAVQHGGFTYLLAGPEQRRQFLDQLEGFAMSYAGNDPVLRVDGDRHIAGKTDFCVTYQGRLYLFASQATLTRFRATPQRYAVAAAGN